MHDRKHIEEALTKLPKEQADIIRDLLEVAMSQPPANLSQAVSHAEFAAAMLLVDAKISASELKQRNWVMGGLIAFALLGGSGYVSLIGKLNQLSDNMPELTATSRNTNETLQIRALWMGQVQSKLSEHDAEMRKLDPNYMPSDKIAPPSK